MDIQNKIKAYFSGRTEIFKWYYGFIYLLIVTIPLNHKEWFSFYNPDLTLPKFSLTLLAITGFYLFCVEYKKYIKDVFFLVLLLLVGFQVLSLTQSKDIESSLQLIAFNLAVVFAYIPVRDYISNRKNALRELILLYSFVFVPIALFVGLQSYLYVGHGIKIGGIWPVFGYPTRYGSTFWDINHFGAFCSALALVLGGYILSVGLKLKTKIFLVSVTSLVLISLYFTSSRSSFLGLFAGVCVFLFLKLRKDSIKGFVKAKVSLLYLGTLSFVSGVLYLFYAFADPIKESLLYRSVSFFSHLFLLKVGVSVGVQNFLFGIGANSFHAYFRETEWADIYYYIDRAALNLKLPLHNLWLEVLAETGLMSFVVFVSFWILLLTGLYRLYQKNNDTIALGFIGGITSFLIGGFMYSYKSEFFWMFVLISSAYVSKYYFVNRKSRIADLIKNLLCPEKCDLTKIALIVLSCFSFIFPMFYLIQPLSNQEINLFYGGFEPSPISDLYTRILMLFRYVIGNYTYTGRIVSLLFYTGSAVLAFIILRRYFKEFYSIVFVAGVFGIINIFEPNLTVSIKWFTAFILLSIAAGLVIALSLINKRVQAFDLRNKTINSVLLILFISVLVAGVVSGDSHQRKSHPNNLVFLMELVYNRGFLNGALVQAGDSIELNSIYYFADEVLRTDSGSFIIAEGVVVPVSGYDLENYQKNVFIYSRNDANILKTEGFIVLFRDNPGFKVTELTYGGFNVALIEKAVIAESVSSE